MKEGHAETNRHVRVPTGIKAVRGAERDQHKWTKKRSGTPAGINERKHARTLPGITGRGRERTAQEK